MSPEPPVVRVMSGQRGKNGWHLKSGANCPFKPSLQKLELCRPDVGEPHLNSDPFRAFTQTKDVRTDRRRFIRIGYRDAAARNVAQLSAPTALQPDADLDAAV